jgi:hypothetical protein
MSSKKFTSLWDSFIISVIMEDKVINNLAYCGLYCLDCVRYQDDIAENAQRLLNALKANTFDKYAEAKKRDVTSFENYNKFLDVVEDITKLHCDAPCRIGGGCSTFECQIVKCCKEKGYEGCWQCQLLGQCDKFHFLEAFHGDFPVRNSLVIREYGIEGFPNKRYPAYKWTEIDKTSKK